MSSSNPNLVDLITETKAGNIILTIVCWIFLPALGIALGFWISTWDWSAAATPLAAQTPAMLLDLAMKLAGVLAIFGVWVGWVKWCAEDQEVRAGSAVLGLSGAGLLWIALHNK